MNTTYAEENDRVAQPSRRMETLAATLCVVITGLIVVGAQNIDVRTETGGFDPRSWPTILGWVGLGLSVALLASSALRPPPARAGLDVVNRRGVLRCVTATILTGAYIAVWDLTDFRVATPVFLALVVAVFGGRTWQSLALYPLLTTTGIYLLFHTVLQVPL